MKTIEIRTTQNVSIEYNTATLTERILAFLLDQVIIWASIGLLVLIATGFGGSSQTFFMLFFILIFGFYTLAWELFNNGQSPGKKAMGIRVVKIHGAEIGFYDYFMRWAFRLIDIASTLGTMAALTITSSPRSQRIGDFLADTAVIKITATGRLSLERIRQLNLLENYEPKYPQINQLSESELLLIKEVMMRYTKYPTVGHDNALNNLIKKLEQQLGIQPNGDRIEFLKTLIKDYVALTR